MLCFKREVGEDLLPLRLICIIGIDGSGKTAHAKKLLSELKKSGRKCKYVWSREPYFFSFPLMYFYCILHFTKTVCVPDKQIQSEHKYNVKPVALVWPWVRLVDLIIWIIWQVYIPIWRGSVVICDRFIHDILVDTMIDINNLRLYNALVGQLILKLIPSFSMVVMLDISEATASQRKNDITHLEYLVVRRRLYHEIAFYLKIPIINTDKPFNLVHKDLREIVISLGNYH